MPKLSIDGREVEVREGATVLHAARALGIDIPSLCHLDGFEPSTSCMACVVRIDGARSLVPSCATPARDGMEVESETADVRAARRTALELLVSDHTGDCVAPCQTADAAHADIPAFLRRVASGDVEGAAAILEAAGIWLDDPDRLDLARAEKACRRGRFDEALAIGRLARFASEMRVGPSAVEEEPPEPRTFSVRTGRLSPEEMVAFLGDGEGAGQARPAEPEGAFLLEEAQAEARRCTHCDCRQAHSCRLRDACEAYGVQVRRFRTARRPLEVDRSHPDILHEPGKCILCGLCVQVAERAGERIGLAFVGRGFGTRLRTPFGVPLAAALGDSAGACADVCPTGALSRIRSG